MQTIQPPAAVTDIGHYIGGKRVAGTSGRAGEVFDPATGAQTGRVAFAAVSEVDAAVAAAAARTFPAWSDILPRSSRRATVMFRFREVVFRRDGRIGHGRPDHGRARQNLQ